MVFLNDEFIAQKDAKISTLDRGFLFGDGVYEVIPVYANNIFQLEQHLLRLDNSLQSINITNPYTHTQYKKILTQLLQQNAVAKNTNQAIYLQITRGVGAKRSHNFKDLKPTIYARVDCIKIKSFNELKQGFSAIIMEDIRWQNCHIKSISLLANVLYVQEAQIQGVEEVILTKNGIITEGASSNVFILKDKKVLTPKLSNNILAGITRNMVLKSCQMAQIDVIETDITTQELLNAQEVWISSSTRELMPITMINLINGNEFKYEFTNNSQIWSKIYKQFQLLKSTSSQLKSE